MNDKTYACFGFVIGLAVGCFLFGAISSGTDFLRSGCDTDRIESLERELSETTARLDSIRGRLEESSRVVEEGKVHIDTIGNAIERIREQTKILEKYYIETRSLCDSRDSNNNCNGQKID